ncbi:MAG: helix-turn-helix transcriptional regulator [Rhodobacteraceae bacterium]|nr:helix-turn-helix transcriptional regulator [Paracoccaceae bacterium]
MSEIVTFDGKVTQTRKSAGLNESEMATFLALVGDRVRQARGRVGMTRLKLAEKSGVSQRYLAQLEAGQGNISIALLLRVADALDFGIEWLVAEGDPWSSEIARATFLMQTATKAQRAAVFEVLEPKEPDQDKASRIALIGLRGAGKSTLGRMAANALDQQFLELQPHVEEKGGMPVEDVIALYGQEGYRLLERQAIEQVVATHEAVILAVAGGIASQSETFNYLLRHYHTIWLKAEPEEHMERVRAQGDMRPMSENPNAMKELRAILKAREEQYSRADVCVDTSGASKESSLTELMQAIRGLL